MGCKSCLISASNVGTLSTTTMGLPIGPWYMPLVADDGTRNALDASAAPITYAEIVALINHPDPSKRIYPAGELKGIENARADAAFETFGDDSKAKLRDGLKSFVGMRKGQDARHLAKWESLFCKFDGNLGAFIVDVCENIHGDGYGDKKLYPTPINTLSADFKHIPQSDTAATAVQHKFDWARYTADKNLYMYRAGIEIEDGAILTTLNGLVDIFGEFSNIDGATGLDAKLTADYGGMYGEPLTGFVATDLTFTKQSDGTTFQPDAITYDENGLATITWALPVAADTLNLSISKDGYDSTILSQVDIVIP